jgi:hypothetical protein
MFGGGEQVISMDKDGLPFVNSMSERHIQVISKVSGLMSDTTSVFLIENFKGKGDPYEAIGKAVGDGNVSMFHTTVAGIPNLRSHEFDFGILPFPKLDENQSEYRNLATSYSSGASSVSIPITASNLERTGLIIEAMSGYSTDIIIPALMDVSLKSKYTRDEESWEMIELILKTKSFDALIEYGWGRIVFGGLYWDVYSTITIKGFDNFVSSLEKQTAKTETDMEKFINTFDTLK